MMVSPRAVARVLLATTIAGTAACGSDSTGTSGAPDVSGSWSISATLTNAQIPANCSIAGTVNLVQNGNSLTATNTAGSETCTVSGAMSTSSIVGGTATGTLSGSNITITTTGAAPCTFTGTVTGSPPNKASGTVNCPVQFTGTTVALTGNWQITR